MKKLLIMGASNPEILRLVDGVNRTAPEDPIGIVGFVDNYHQKATQSPRDKSVRRRL